MADVGAGVTTWKLLPANASAHVLGNGWLPSPRTAGSQALVLSATHPGFADLDTPEMIAFSTIDLLLDLPTQAFRHNTLITFPTGSKVALPLTRVVATHEGFVAHVPT